MRPASLLVGPTVRDLRPRSHAGDEPAFRRLLLVAARVSVGEMAKETCRSCEVRLDGSASFCPSCGQPTRYATDAERLDWDLHEWRAHVDRSVAAGVHPSGSPNGGMSSVRGEAETAVATQTRPEQVARFHVLNPRLPRERRESSDREPNTVIELDRDHEFAYRACATCEATDWIVRTTRNGDETWNYWCARCSRSFKTEVKIPQAWKPFLSVVIVVGALLAASFLMLR